MPTMFLTFKLLGYNQSYLKDIMGVISTQLDKQARQTYT